MSFLRHGQIYQSDVASGLLRKRSLQPRFRHHRFDEFAAGYSLQAVLQQSLPPLHQPVPFSIDRLNL